MSIVVEFNQETYQEFFVDILIEHPSLYTQPPKAVDVNLEHIHIAMPPNTFPKNRPQSDRKCPMNSPQQDAALVYARGELYKNHYSLIALFHPDAHSLARDPKLMNRLIEVADRFQESLWD